jgi:hypothetical protein
MSYKRSGELPHKEPRKQKYVPLFLEKRSN